MTGATCALQNSLQDLYGILSFLRVEPLDNRAVFSRTIQRPIRAGDPQGIMRTQVHQQGCLSYTLTSAPVPPSACGNCCTCVPVPHAWHDVHPIT